MKSDLYICKVILKTPVDRKSYLAALPAVRGLEDARDPGRDRSFADGTTGAGGLDPDRGIGAGCDSAAGGEFGRDRSHKDARDSGRDRTLQDCATGAGGLEFHSRVTFFAGENGTGKSTLLEAIAVAYGFNPEGGSKNYRFATAESHSGLWENLTLVKHRFPKDGFFLRAESFYNVASYIDELDSEPAGTAPLIASYGGRSLHRQSHGESFMSLIENRFGGRGLYLLDEPEAALSPMRLFELLREIKRLVDLDSQLVIATHSPILLAFPGAEILRFSEDGIARVAYKDTEHYQATRRFLENPDKMLRAIFGEEAIDS